MKPSKNQNRMTLRMVTLSTEGAKAMARCVTNAKNTKISEILKQMLQSLTAS